MNLIKLFLLTSILWFVPMDTVKAQNNLELLEFRRLMGLSTAIGDFQRDSGSFMPNLLHNIDLYRFGLGTYGKRFGFRKSYEFPGSDSILGIAAINYRDGRNQMIAAVDSAFPTDYADLTGYANIYVSGVNSDKFSATGDSATFYIKVTDLALEATADTMNFNFRIWNTSGFSDDPMVMMVDTIAVSDANIRTVNDWMVDTLNLDPVFSVHWTAGIIDDTTFFILGDGDETAYNLKYQCGLGSFFGTPCCNIEEAPPFPNPFDSWCWQFEETRSVGFTLYPAFTPDDRIITEWGTQYPTSFAQYNDMMFIANGSQTMKVYNGDIVIDYPPNAPGQMTVVPYAGDGNPNAVVSGEVRYGIVYHIDSVSYDYSDLGYVTPPIKNILGMNMLKDFPMPAIDAVETDTIFIRLYRSYENSGQIDPSDYMKLIKDTFFTPASDISNYTYIDSASNSDIISVTDSIPTLDDGFANYWSQIVNDSSTYRYGAPVAELGAWETGTITPGVDEGIYLGGVANITLGWSYAVTYIDTVLNIESALGPSYYLKFPGGSNKYPTLRIPKPNAPYGLKKNLYRATISVSSYDSTLREHFNQETGDLVYSFWKFNPAGDTIIGPYRFVAQLSIDSVLYQDTVAIQTIDFTAKQPSLTAPPFGLSNIFTHDNRLWGLKGSQLWYSEQNTLEWPQFNLEQFDPDDGDQGTVGFPFRGGVFYSKNFSTYNLFGESFTSSEITGAPGCVSTKGHAKASGKDYYISNAGAISISEAKFQLRHHEPLDLSFQIDNFSKKTFSQLQSCVTTYVPQLEQVWFSIEDTTYVWDIRAQGWTTSSLRVAGSCLYDIDSGAAFFPGRTLYYYQPGGSDIFVFGNSEYDFGVSNIIVHIESGAMLLENTSYQVYGVGLWNKNIGTNDDYAVLIGFFGTEDTLLTATNKEQFNRISLEKRNTQLEISYPPQVLYRLVIYAGDVTNLYSMDSTGIDKIDIYYKKIQDVILK